MNSKKNLKRNLLICLLAGSAVMYTLPLHAATSVVANNALPQGGQFMGGSSGKFDYNNNGLELNVHQNDQNAVIKWGSFDVGGSATVNFTAADAFKNNFNTLNYVNSGSASQIYGTINGLGGNIYVVNTAGVQIGPSAQINVGSLYVSNNVLDDSVFNNFVANANNANFDLGGTPTTYTDAALMSLGNINANNVTFEGNGRIVIDSERLINGNNSMGAANINIETAASNTGNIVIGYDSYNENTDSYNTAGTTAIAKVNGQDFAQNQGYMWVEDVEQLQAIGKNAESLTGNYALRNSIDATSTEQNGFTAIGSYNDAFKGKFDGIDYNIFGLTINGNEKDYVGLFGVTNGATINNVTLVGGNVSGGSDVGAIIGYANDTTISNAVNSASVTGEAEVGGIVGTAINSTITNAVNTGKIESVGKTLQDGSTLSNAGGLIGYMYNGTLGGNSYNLGNVSGNGYNVGGLIGHAVNSTIGDGTNLVYNRMDVTGAYNVGGIVGNMDGTTVQNAENSGNVTATGYTTETYYYYAGQKNNDNSISTVRKNETVNVANVGGIAGKADDTANKESVIKNVTNSGNVSSSKQANNDFYDAGNVGGIVGSAVDTDISNATNKENDVRGAHNVGGVAGYFGGSATITGGINDGGDIMATGARNGSRFVKEKIRPGDIGGEQTIIGNMGGVVGYLDGDSVYVTASGNRGTVHSLDITGDTVSEASQASNTGGIVGKINRGSTKLNKDILGENYKYAAVSNSYNTGDVRGYMGVGGVVGMMYNGEVAGSYNLGTVNTTRRAQDTTSDYPSVNMGGVVGDTTEETNAQAFIYDVYNKGHIGDETYQYYARHVGGVVGRLSGTVEKAYNTGNIYNGYTVVGGIAGWFYKGNINNVFNTGNITVVNNDTSDGGSQVGGIAGGVGLYSGSDSSISYAYNLGTIRSFTNNKPNYIGGIIGKITEEGSNKLDINNVYTTGNLYAQVNGSSNSDGLNSIYGYNESNNASRITIKNAIYITPEDTTYFVNLKDNNDHQHTVFIDYGQRDSIDAWKNAGFSFSDNGSDDGTVGDEQSGDWRIYDGTTPILNAFLPNAEDYFSGEAGVPNTMDGINAIQYGTAYDPLLTIINANKDLSFDWGALDIKNDGGLAVYNAGLTLTDFKANGGTGYFGGIIYADGSLKLDGNDNNIGLGSASQIYGSDVTIDTTGNITIYGDVTATGNSGKSDIDISSENGDVNVYGTLTSATKGEETDILGIKGSSLDDVNLGNISDEYDEVTNMGERYSYTTEAQETGDITISAGTYDEEKEEVVSEGNVNLYFGNQEEGLITTGGNLTVEATGDVYVDSDLDIGGDMTLTSTGADSEVLLTLTNIGKVQANRFTDIIESAINGIEITENNEQILTDAILNAVNKAGTEHTFTGTQAGNIVHALLSSVEKGNSKVEALNELKEDIAVAYMHDFMHSFAEETQNKIALNAASGDAKLTVDMWVENTNGSGQFNFEKYDTTFPGTNDKHTFKEELNHLNFAINDDMGNASESVYVEVSTGEQLKAIQNAGSKALEYNYALMGDINASDVTDYKAIGGENGEFTGTFDGRGNRIIGLDTTKDSNGTNNNSMAKAGIFSTIGESGTVKNVNIYSGNFEGKNTAGAVAGENNGRIENIITFGNTVTATGDNGNAGGIVGINNAVNGKIVTNEDGTITLEPVDKNKPVTGIIDVESTGSVIAGNTNAIAGGLVGTNNGTLGNSYSNSAVTSTSGTDDGLGGVVGVNEGTVSLVDSLGVTNGTNSTNVGGVIGINSGTLSSAYNESIVNGYSNVGGIIGENSTGGTVTNIVNATGVTGEDESVYNVSEYVGGLVGINGGSVENGRNNGTITGTKYVGGMVGSNAQGATLTNITNDSFAAIEGEQYVGGIAGSNAGKISATDDTLINRGSITGNKFVGGVAGVNEYGGTIENTISNIELNVKTPYTNDSNSDNDPAFFGGVVGQNSGTIIGATNQSSVDVDADGATYVGGIIGQNTSTGTLEGKIRNGGTVSGLSNVGGIIGENKNANLLNNDDNNERLEITNTGSVRATQGGAAGIFYSNNISGTEGDTNANAINNVDITNSGTVTGGTDEKSVTGGLFGINSGNITNSTLTNTGVVTGGGTVGGLIGTNSGSAKDSTFTNSGTVSGNTNVGGLFGTNSGKFETSSLINTVNGQVIGTNNVGGLIGKNTGTIEGGRDANDSYYKYQIYNNGTITGTGSGSNIGGLIGENAASGRLTAGYNTGAINASNSTNVGGIAGSNAGIIGEVFNTVMTADGQNQTITGGTNVGGLVGNNSGTLSNAYNTTEVKGNANVGTIIGNNATNNVSNVYNT